MKDSNQLNDKIVAIIVAAGNGTRMQHELPKQYIKLGYFTILEYTLEKFVNMAQIDRIIVVINEKDHYFNKLAISAHPKMTIAYGGKNRSDSVLAGLNMLQNDEWALVHDAARCCVTQTDIEKLIEAVLTKNQGGILATRVTDTIKKSVSEDSDLIKQTIDRQQLWAAATPQMFKAGDLKQGLLKAIHENRAITDEASAIELINGKAQLVTCRKDNIKVTHNEDLALAKLYLQEQGLLTS
ncbi:2-C-methyl-D-erythritol 4-phosphate cytidylyltransferase [Orbaceae bacterium ac157xtp]